MKARDAALGPKEKRGINKGSLPCECFEDGSVIRATSDEARCYPLGVSYERTTVLAAPNSNVKIIDGKVDKNTQLRAELLKVFL